MNIKKIEWRQLLYPNRCPFCNEVSTRNICNNCRKKLEEVAEPMCMQCGKQLFDEQQIYCSDCEKEKHFYEQGRSLWIHKPPVSDAIYRFKYENHRYMADFFAACCQTKYPHLMRDWGIKGLIPVPMHRKAKQKRGYNQAEILAQSMARYYKIPVYTKVVYRVKKTIPMKNLGRTARKENLKKAFEVSCQHTIPDTIMLIDDIYTTGTTVSTIAQKIKEKQPVKVYFFTISIGQGF